MSQLPPSSSSAGRAPGFSVAVVLTLALCIGANLTIMSVWYGLIIESVIGRQIPLSDEVFTIMGVAPRS